MHTIFRTFSIILVAIFYGFLSLEAAESTSPESTIFSGRVRSLSMTRDYEGKGTGSNSTLGVLLHAEGGLSGSVDGAATYIYAEELFASGQSDMLANNDIRILNEAWLRYKSGPELALQAGRVISNGEIFQKDDSRQKPRAIEAAQVTLPWLNAGHALRMSHYFQSGDRWKFNDFEKVFNVEGNSEGVSWVDMLFTPNENVEVGVYDAFAWNITHLVGTRIKWNLSTDFSFILYARMESGAGDNEAHSSETYGLSLQKSWGKLKLEPGLLSVHGDTMLFQETTTGFNHALASSMIIYTSPFDGGADTFYLKATTTLGNTGVYLLGMYSVHDQQPYDAEEVNFVLKQPLTEHLDLAFKAGLGYRENDNADNTTATDARLFLTYGF